MKYCWRCQQTKALDNYYMLKSGRPSGYCKPCAIAVAAERYRAKRDLINTQQRARRQSRAPERLAARLARQPSSEQKFWWHTVKGDGCWLWTGKVLNHYGYGVITGRRSDKAQLAHRVSWELHVGPIPEGLEICHKCDTPACVRPDHLFLGTHADNMADMRAKGRAGGFIAPSFPRFGEHSGQARLADEQVLAIRATYLPRVVTQVELARRFGVSRGAICSVLIGRTWRHLLPTARMLNGATA